MSPLKHFEKLNTLIQELREIEIEGSEEIKLEHFRAINRLENAIDDLAAEILPEED